MGIGAGAEHQRGESCVAQGAVKTYRPQSSLELICLHMSGSYPLPGKNTET